jgi:hypothetical protein
VRGPYYTPRDHFKVHRCFRSEPPGLASLSHEETAGFHLFVEHITGLAFCALTLGNQAWQLIIYTAARKPVKSLISFPKSQMAANFTQAPGFPEPGPGGFSAVLLNPPSSEGTAAFYLLGHSPAQSAHSLNSTSA